ncbi:DUF3801 domain-containing protein [Bacillus luti]|uniref:DUF3801 domain-containing protein n=1 Tax=Bacillus luti TaxID=2026191 RepID=UPI00268262CD
MTKLLENKEQDPKDYILDGNTKDGKQKFNGLIKKHSNTGGVIALDKNLTKEQLKDYQKEFKKLGVDFSIVRNGKEDYSLFFSAAQAIVIEKALKNIVERKNSELEKIKVNNKEEVGFDKDEKLQEIIKPHLNKDVVNQFKKDIRAHDEEVGVCVVTEQKRQQPVFLLHYT